MAFLEEFKHCSCVAILDFKRRIDDGFEFRCVEVCSLLLEFLIENDHHIFDGHGLDEDGEVKDAVESDDFVKKARLDVAGVAVRCHNPAELFADSQMVRPKGKRRWGDQGVQGVVWAGLFPRIFGAILKKVMEASGKRLHHLIVLQPANGEVERTELLEHDRNLHVQTRRFRDDDVKAPVKN